MKAEWANEANLLRYSPLKFVRAKGLDDNYFLRALGRLWLEEWNEIDKLFDYGQHLYIMRICVPLRDKF